MPQGILVRAPLPLLLQVSASFFMTGKSMHKRIKRVVYAAQ